MKSIINQISAQNRLLENADREAVEAEIQHPATSNKRRDFLKKAALGGVGLAGLMHLSVEDTIAQTTAGVSRA